MNKYTFTFEARIIGAIGKTSKWTQNFEAENLTKAKQWLYNHYEHLRLS